MPEKECLFDYNWTKAKNLNEARFFIARDVEALQVVRGDDNENEFTLEEIKQLGQMIAKSPHMVAISLRDCALNGDLVAEFLRELQKSEYLESLILSENEIGETGADAVGDYLENTSTLKHLDLSSCGIQSSGHQIVDSLEANNSLRSLIMDNNQEMSPSAVVALFEYMKVRKNIVNLSLLNTFCDMKNCHDVFNLLKRNQTLLFVGFPTFFNGKRTDNRIFTSSDSLDVSFSRDDLIPFHETSVQKQLHDSLKGNFSVVRIYNSNPRSDIQLLLKRNLMLMKNEFNDILTNDAVPQAIVGEQKVIILGRKHCGKSTLLESLFGENFINHSKLFELQIKKKLVVMNRTEGATFSFKEVKYDYDTDLSFKVASKLWSRRSEKMKKNEKFLKLSKAIGFGGDARQGRKKNTKGGGRARSARNKLRFFNVPNPEEQSNSFYSDRAPPTYPHSHRDRVSKVKNFSMDARYRFDSTNSDPINSHSGANPYPLRRRTSTSFDEADLERNSDISGETKMTPAMRQTEILDNFKPEIVARYGNNLEKVPVLLRVKEISNKITNGIMKDGRRGTQSGRTLKRIQSLASNTTTMTSKTGKSSLKKFSEAEKYGDINYSLVDLNNFVYGVKDDDGIYLLMFNLKTMLKYFKVSEGHVIANNPVMLYLSKNINAIFNYSLNNTIILVGSNYDTESMSVDETKAVNKLISKTIQPRFYKKLLKFKRGRSNEDFCFYPVDSVSSLNIDVLKKTLLSRLRRTGKTSGRSSSSVPLKWLRVLDILKQQKKENKNFISRDKLLEKVAEFGFNKVEDLVPVLQYLHRRNDVVYFHDVEILKDFVVLNKAFIYFCAYQLLNRRYLTKMLNDKNVRSKLREEQLGQDFFMYQNRKLLSRDLIEFLWRSNNHYLINKKVENIEKYYDENKAAYLYVIEILKKVLFLTEWKNVQVNTGVLSSESGDIKDFHSENYFVVPSLLKNMMKPIGNNTNPREVKSLKDLESSPKSLRAKDKKLTTTGLKARAQNRLSKKRIRVSSPNIQLNAYNSLPDKKISLLSEKMQEMELNSIPSSGTVLEKGSDTVQAPVRNKTGSIDASYIVSSRGKRDFDDMPMRARGCSKDNGRTRAMEKSGDPAVRNRTTAPRRGRPKSKSTRNANRALAKGRKKGKLRKGTGVDRRSASVRSASGRRATNLQEGGSSRPTSSEPRRTQTESRLSQRSRMSNRSARRSKSPDKEASYLARLEHMNPGGKKHTAKKILLDAMKRMDGSMDPPTSICATNYSPRSGSQPPVQQRFMLDRNKPVSLLLDFKESFLPDGYFVRLCSILYDDYSKSNSDGPKIEQVDLYKNYFKITFDSIVKEIKQEESNFEGTMSLSGSEFDSISVIAEAKKLVETDAKEEKEYIMLSNNGKSDTIICVVRNHDRAPEFLAKLKKAVDTIEGIHETDVVKDGMAFYNVIINFRVEVKNNKFVKASQAEERQLAPWFAKNRLVKRKSRKGTRISQNKKYSLRSAYQSDDGISAYSSKRRDSKESEDHMNLLFSC